MRLIFLLLGCVGGLFAQSDLAKMNTEELDSVVGARFKGGDFKGALPYARRNVEICKGKDSLYADRLVSLSVLYTNLGWYEDSEENLLRAAAIERKLLGTNNLPYAQTLGSIGILYRRMERHADAEAAFLEAKKIIEANGGKLQPLYAQALNNLAVLYEGQEKFEQAEAMYKEAQLVWEASDDTKSPKYAGIINNLGILYLRMHRFSQAKIYLDKTLKIKAEIVGTQHPSYAVSLSNLSKWYIEKQDFAKARQLLLQAADIQRRTNGDTHPEYFQTLANIATLGLRDNDPQAVASLLTVIHLYRLHYPDQPQRSLNYLNNIAHFYQKNNQLDSAQYYYRQALQINAQLPSFELASLAKATYLDFPEALKSLQNLYLCQNQPRSLQYLEIAAQINTAARNSFALEESKLRSLRTAHAIASLAIAAALDSNPAQAFDFAEQNKAALLADATRAQRARSLGDLPDSLARLELRLQNDLEALRRRLADPKESSQRTTIQGQINDLLIEINAFKQTIEQKYPKYYQLKYANTTATAADIQKNIPDKTLLLEFFVADNAIYLFAIDKKQISAQRLDISLDTLKNNLAQLRDALSNYQLIHDNREKSYQLFTENAHALYASLLQNILTQKTDIQRLAIVADGELGHIPFEVLLRQPAQDRHYRDLPYLLRDYAISYHYSASLWLQNQRPNTQKAPLQMLAAASDYQNGRQNSTRTSTTRRMLRPLPAAQEEVRQLSQLMPGTFLQKEQANEAFFKQHAHEYAVIHLAMHGLLDANNPMLSALAFTENGDSTQDNFLEAWEIAQLQLKAQLVVLSACETGYGQFRHGEGVISLARSFMYAGSPSLLVSLWQVNDQVTSQIMLDFYRRLLDGQPKDIALQQTKLQYLKNGKDIAAHPAFWAAFVQIGNTQPLNIAPKNTPIQYLFYFGATALSVLALTFGYIKKRKAQRT